MLVELALALTLKLLSPLLFLAIQEIQPWSESLASEIRRVCWSFSLRMILTLWLCSSCLPSSAHDTWGLGRPLTRQWMRTESPSVTVRSVDVERNFGARCSSSTLLLHSRGGERSQQSHVLDGLLRGMEREWVLTRQRSLSA